MMKKTLGIALLALLLAALAPLSALAAAGDANIVTGDALYETYLDYASGGCVLGDALYFYGNSHIFSYHLGDAGLTAAKFEPPEMDEGESWSLTQLFSDGEALYALCPVYYSDGDSSGIDRLEIREVELDGDTATFGEPQEVDIDELTANYGGDGDYLVQINDTCCLDGTLMLFVYDDAGEEKLYALDLSSGEGEFVEAPEGMACITAYEDGCLLIEAADYDRRACEFYLYDPQAEELSDACESIEFGADDSFDLLSGLAWSAESGRLFYMSDGYVMAAEDFDFENAQRVAELSSLYYEQRGGLLLPGDYYVYAGYDSIAVRATDPEALPQTRLVIRGAGYSGATMAAYYAFGNTHGDVAVVLDQDSFDADKVIEGMMNRDDSVDIYMTSVAGQTYDALYNRGFMVELDNEAIAAAVAEMYPAIREAITRDGKVVAVPVGVYGWVPGLDYEGFEKIGIARGDVPTNWKELIDLLPELAEKLPEDGSVRLFSEYQTQGTERMDLLSAVFSAWRARFSVEGETPRYDDPDLAALMDAVLALDLEAMGLPEDDGTDDASVAYAVSVAGDGRTYQLLQTSVGATMGNFYSDAEPVPMSALPGEQGYIPLSLSVAFVNPFSKNVELAQEFLATLMANLGPTVLYNLSDKYNEPVRDQRTLAYMDEVREEIEEMKAQLEEAEAVDRPALEEQIQVRERMLEEQEEYTWEISAEDIAWYRGHADCLYVEHFDYMDAADEDGEISDLAEQLLAGRVKSAEFLRELDRKVRMRAMEGN